ncbi:MAG: hypothetical protein CSA97_00940 [Bacteroidetes bacterium]|nr:MAG: hypothetical protein CSA97_00940 [Bacteroidota bacterium]
MSVDISSAIALRALEPEDLEYLYTYENAPERYREGTVVYPVSRYQLRAFVENGGGDGEQLRLIGYRPGDDSQVGCLDFFRMDRVQRTGYLGIGIFPPYLRGKGYGCTLLQAGLNYGFGVLGLRAIAVEVMARNTVALALFEGEGFERVGLLPQWFRTPDGSLHDVVVLLRRSAP